MDPVERQIFLDFLQTKPMKAWGGIILHHSATPDSNKSHNIAAIRRYHKSYRVDGEIVSGAVWEERRAKRDGKIFLEPWRDVSYHFMLERRNNKIVYEVGRPFDEDGAHSGHKTSNRFNTTHLGICVVGNFDVKEPDIELWRTTLAFTRIFRTYLEIPKESVIGHCEVYGLLGVGKEKSCPGEFWSMAKFRTEL